MSLTELFITNKAKAGAKRIEYADGKNGLALCVQPSGHRSWIVRYRSPITRKPSKLTLGNADFLKLADARKLAVAAMARVAAGVDPATERREKQDAAQAAAADTLASVIDTYFQIEGGELRSAGPRRAVLANHVLPRLGRKPISSITRSDITHLLDDLQVRISRRSADLVHDYLSRIFTWHAARHGNFNSPFIRGMRRQKSPPQRHHTLSDAEIRAFWDACEKWDGPQSRFLRFLLLTATRRNEAAFMLWSELSPDGAEWVVPGRRYKTGVDVLIPLSKKAREILDGCHRLVGPGFVFSTTGRHGANDFTRMKVEIDRRMTAELGHAPAPWRFHDLRRTARTLLSRAGVNADVGERCLGHVIGGVRGVYDRHSFKEEKAHAFEALAALVALIVNPPADNVVPIIKA